MTIGPIRATIHYGEPCACEAQTNPPADPDITGIAGLYDTLGRAAALGALADQLGNPDGLLLVEMVADFVATSSATMETGGVLSSVAQAGARLSGPAAKSWAKVEGYAAAAWKAAADNPKVLLRLGGVVTAGLLASQWLSANERTKLVALNNQHALTAEWVLSQDPETAAKFLRDTQIVTQDKGILAGIFGELSPAVETLAWCAGIGGAAYLAWSMYRQHKRDKRRGRA